MEGMSLPDGFVRSSNCGVVATAIASGRSYPEVHNHFAAMYKHGNWKGGTNRTEREKVLNILGVSYKKWDFFKIVVEEINGHKNVSMPFLSELGYNKSLRLWIKGFTRPGKRYMVTTTGHVQIVKDGYVIDQEGLKHISLYRFKNKRVVDVIELEN